MFRPRIKTGRRVAAIAIAALFVAGCGAGSTATNQLAGATGGPTAVGTAPAASGGSSTDATPAPTPTQAADLIQADVQAGAIDADTGMLYRLEAEFGAPGLPAKYASAPAVEDEAVFDMTAHALSTMPADMQAQILPFIVRPTDSRSVFHGPATGALTAPNGAGGEHAGGQLADVAPPAGAANAGAGAAPGDEVPVCNSDGWASVSSEAIPVTVWGECVGEGLHSADLTAALTAIESVYPGEVSLMGDPVPDTGDADAGGSPNIDIYLVGRCVTRDGDCNEISNHAAGVTIPTNPFSGPDGANTSSAFILVPRTYATSPVDLKSILAHEMFHVLENAYNEQGRVENGHSYWMTEACAKWAEEFFVPEGRANWVYPWFGDFQTTDQGLTTVNGRNEYVSFVWPQFLNLQIGPSAIQQAWKAFEGQHGWAAFNAQLAGILSFKDNFKDFAITAWNTAMPGGGTPDLIDPKFQTVDSNFPKTAPAKPTKFYFRHPPALKLSDPAIQVPETMPALSVRYAELELGDDVQQLIVDFSGLQPDEPLDVTALVHIKGGQWEKRTLPTAKTTFCRNQDDIDRVLFVLDNNNYTASSIVSGSWQYQAVADACSPGSFNLTVANGPDGKHAGAGTYTGQAPIDCSESDNVWDAAFVDKNGINGIESITIDMDQPEFVTVSTVSHNDNVDEFDVQQGFDYGAVSISVDDQGKIVKLTAHATSLFAKIDVAVTCGSILRG